MWRLDGIDVAHPYQYRPTLIDWPSVPPLELICHKVGEGLTYTDPMAQLALPAIEAKGTRYVGAYFWIRPDSDPVLQAKHYTADMYRMGGFPVGRFCQLDIETTLQGGKPLPPVTADAIRAWVDYVNEFAQREVVSRYQGRYHPAFYDPSLQSIPLWQPDYTSAPSVPWAIVRQWGGGGNGATVSGIASGRVDSNEILNRAVLDHLCGYEPSAQTNQDQLQATTAGGDDVTDDDLRKVHDVAFSAMLEVIRSDEYKALLVEEAHAASIDVMRSDEVKGIISEVLTSASHQPAEPSPQP